MIVTFDTIMTHSLYVEVDLPSDATEEEIREYLMNNDPDVISIESPTNRTIMKNAWCELECGTPVRFYADSPTEEEALAKQEGKLPVVKYYT